jgi:type IV secretory pathway VirB4 component
MADRGTFHLGRLLEPATGTPGSDELVIGPSDLTTHGVIVGMTGSGKTGLAIDLLEQALLAGIPALIMGSSTRWLRSMTGGRRSPSRSRRQTCASPT